MERTPKNVKCVLVGDNGAGKTTLLIRYTTARLCPSDQLPTVYDNYAMKAEVHDEVYHLSLWDTHKPDEHDRLRPLSYPGTDILLHFCPGVPWLLIGTRVDERSQYDAENSIPWRRPVTTEEGIRAAKKLGASKYIECSSRERFNVDEVFEQAIIVSQLPRKPKKKKRSCVVL